MSNQLQLAQNLNLRLQAQLEQAEQQQGALFEYLAELQKVAGVSGEQLNTQELYNRVNEMAAKEREAEAPSDE